MRKAFFLALMIAVLLIPACSASKSPIFPPQPSYWPTQGWQTSTPEEQGFDSAWLAEGLLAMRDNQINIHSLMIIHNDKVILDAYLYPYSGETVHELASVTKSVITTLTGMTSGLDCTSANDEQTLIEMGAAPDWVQFTLDLKVKHIPGTYFEYCSPGMHVLSAILQEATGMTASEFARLNLFGLLGITDFI